MKTLNDFLNIVDFLGDDIRPDQALKLVEQAKKSLSIADIQILLDCVSVGAVYYELSRYDAEMGCLSRY